MLQRTGWPGAGSITAKDPSIVLKDGLVFGFGWDELTIGRAYVYAFAGPLGREPTDVVVQFVHVTGLRCNLSRLELSKNFSFTIGKTLLT